MTPMPANVVLEKFPNEQMETAEAMQEEGVSRETARNVAILAEWDEEFDSIVSQDDDGDGDDGNHGSSLPKRGRKRTPFKHTHHGRRRSSSSAMMRPQKSRRESSLFSRTRKSLLDDDENDGDGMDDDDCNHCGLPFSVTIHPEDYASPSSSVATATTPSDISAGTCDDREDHGNDSRSAIEDIEAIETPTDMLNRLLNTRELLESSTSACISPSSSLKSDSASVAAAALENSLLENSSNSYGMGKETPNSARTSSSTILRAVHASGALLPSNSPPAVSGGLRPNQLKYSPSASTERSVSKILTLCDAVLM